MSRSKGTLNTGTATHVSSLMAYMAGQLQACRPLPQKESLSQAAEFKLLVGESRMDEFYLLLQGNSDAEHAVGC